MTLTTGGDPTRTVLRTDPVLDTGPPRRSWEPARLAASTTLLVTACVLVWVIAYLTVLSGFEEGHSQQRLYERFRTELALGEAPSGAPIASGAPVALVDVPAIGLHHVVVVEGTSARDLRNGPGHVEGTVLPGQSGTSVLMGRALTFGAPFGSLDHLVVGDQVVVRTVEGRFVYRVSGFRRQGDVVPALPSSSDSRLTLVSATGGPPLGSLHPSSTLDVDATLSSHGLAAQPVSAPDPRGKPMRGDHGALTLTELALALELLVLVFVAVAWARTRWSTLAAWMTGVPVVLAALWVVSSVAVLLLPNLV